MNPQRFLLAAALCLPLSSWGQGLTQATLLKQGEASLTRARGLAFTAYQRGTASLIDVLHADESLLKASDARAQAQTESARAAVAAFRALGGGWQPLSSDALAARGS